MVPGQRERCGAGGGDKMQGKEIGASPLRGGSGGGVGWRGDECIKFWAHF